ncbi:MAG: hypothetical protein VKM34_01535 [Cyanobacteriota bacterium]|nr:hypothetical protein [Cyanobacteriota bacterium]
MSLSHCPLCMALAVLSTLRGIGHLVLTWQIAISPRTQTASG